jgi:hypothetical protein
MMGVMNDKFQASNEVGRSICLKQLRRKEEDFRRKSVTYL